MNVGLVARRRLRGPGGAATSPTTCRAERCSTSPATRPRSSPRCSGRTTRCGRDAIASSPTGPSDDELRAARRRGRRLARRSRSRATRSRAASWPRVRGTRGFLELDLWGQRVARGGAERAGRPAAGRPGRRRQPARRGARPRAGRLATARNDYVEGLGTLLERFYAAVRGEAPTPVPVAGDGRRQPPAARPVRRGEPAVRALVTGAGGFLGRRLVAELLRAGDEVAAVVRPSRPVRRSSRARTSSAPTSGSRTRSRRPTSRASTWCTTSPRRSRRPGARCSRPT